jgi:hypothetical protein
MKINETLMLAAIFEFRSSIISRHEVFTNKEASPGVVVLGFFPADFDGTFPKTSSDICLKIEITKLLLTANLAYANKKLKI